MGNKYKEAVAARGGEGNLTKQDAFELGYEWGFQDAVLTPDAVEDVDELLEGMIEEGMDELVNELVNGSVEVDT